MLNEDETSLLARMSLNDAGENKEMLSTGAEAMIVTWNFLLKSTAGPQTRLRRTWNKNEAIEWAEEEDKGLACECGILV